MDWGKENDEHRNRRELYWACCWLAGSDREKQHVAKVEPVLRRLVRETHYQE
jgi:hypothetical protein